MGISRFQTFKMNIFPKDFLKNKDFEVILCDATVFPNKQSAWSNYKSLGIMQPKQ